jgi:hypothetical protein
MTAIAAKNVIPFMIVLLWDGADRSDDAYSDMPVHNRRCQVDGPGWLNPGHALVLAKFQALLFHQFSFPPCGQGLSVSGECPISLVSSGTPPVESALALSAHLNRTA